MKKKQKTIIQRGRKLDLMRISQHFMLSLMCPLILLVLVLSILLTQILKRLLLYSIHPPLLVLEPSIQKFR